MSARAPKHAPTRARPHRRAAPSERLRALLRGAERFLPLWLVLLTVLVFAGSLSAGFTYDDQTVVIGNPEIRYWHFWNIFEGWNRSVRLLTLMLDWTLFGESPTGYHVHSLLWHVACVLLLHAVLLRLHLDRWQAFLGALLFAVHPIHVEAVTNIANRKESLCLAFSLLAFLAYARAVGSSGTARWRFCAAAAVAWVVALFGKQVAIALPLVLVAYDLLYVPRAARLIARSPTALGVAGASGAAALVVFLLTVLDFRLDDPRSVDTLAGYVGEPTLSSVALTSARAFWRYVGMLVWPAGLCPDHVVDLSRSLLEPATLVAWLALVGLAVFSLWVARRARLVGFALLWILLNYLPVSNLLPSAYVLADRYMYVPSVGFCILLVGVGAMLHGALARRMPRVARPLMMLLAVGLVVSWSARTLSYNARWQSDRAVWTYTLQCEPRSFRAHNNAGSWASLEGRHEQALAFFARALALNPRLAAAHYNRGNSLYQLGRFGEALEAYDRAIELRPDRAEPYYNRANARLARGELREAIADYDRALGVRGDLPDAHVNRGRAYLRLGELERALADFERALRIQPTHELARANLAATRSVLEQPGATDRSTSSFRGPVGDPH